MVIVTVILVIFCWNGLVVTVIFCIFQPLWVILGHLTGWLVSKNHFWVINVTMDHCVVNAKRRSRRFHSSKNQPLTTCSHCITREAVIVTVIWDITVTKLWHGHWDGHFGLFVVQRSHCDSHFCVWQSLQVKFYPNITIPGTFNQINIASDWITCD